MDGEQTEITRLANAKWSDRAIRSLIKLNPHCRSGVIGVNDALEIMSCQLYSCELNNVHLSYAIRTLRSLKASAVVAFDIIDDNRLMSNITLIDKLNDICEIHSIDLVDVMLIGHDTWVSLRQHNRL